MDLSRDALRRSLRDTEASHRASLPPLAEALQSSLDGDRDGADARAAAAGAALSRRRALRVGGFSVAMGAVLAACAKHGAAPEVPLSGEGATTTALPDQVVDTVALLRTASSIEYVAVDVYRTAIDTVLQSADLEEVAAMFLRHHFDHAKLFDGLVTGLGSTPYTKANPAIVKNVVEPNLATLKADEDVVRFALALEGIAAATYQAFVPLLDRATQRQAIMTVAAVEARHGAALASLLPGSIPVTGFIAGDSTTPPTTAEGAPAPVVQVAGAFGQVAASIGPNSYIYPFTA